MTMRRYYATGKKRPRADGEAEAVEKAGEGERRLSGEGDLEPTGGTSESSANSCRMTATSRLSRRNLPMVTQRAKVRGVRRGGKWCEEGR